MDFWKIEAGKATELMLAGERLPEQGFAWLDLSYDEVDLLQAEVERLTGVRIFDVHVDGALVFTKSMLGRYPEPDDVMPLVQAHLTP